MEKCYIRASPLAVYIGDNIEEPDYLSGYADSLEKTGGGSWFLSMSGVVK